MKQAEMSCTVVTIMRSEADHFWISREYRRKYEADVGGLDCCNLLIGVKVTCHDVRRDRRPTGGAGGTLGMGLRTRGAYVPRPWQADFLAGHWNSPTDPQRRVRPPDTSCQASQQSRAVKFTRQRCLHGSLPLRPRSACCVAQGVEKPRRPHLGMGRCGGRIDARRVQ